MKNLFLLAVVLLTLLVAAPTIAQNNGGIDSGSYNYQSGPKRHRTVIALGPSSLWSPTLKFEQGIGNWVSAGFHARFRFIMWNGGKIEPFVRVYFTEKSPEGPFIQLKGSFGAYRRNFVFDDFCYYDSNGDYICGDSYDEDYFFSFGGGLVGGYQFFFGAKDHFALDLFGGFQYMYQDRSGYNDYRYLRRIFINFPVEVGLRLGVAF